MSLSEYLSPLFGRLVLGWFFLSQVALYGGDWSSTVTLMTFRGVPAAPFVLATALLITALGSAMLILGLHARHGAMLLFGVTVVTAVMMHDYWRIGDNPMARESDFELFACNIAIAGGLLLLVGQGAGPVAFDNKQGKKK